jgi:hypothetical protein
MAKNFRTEDFKLENVKLSYPYLLTLKKTVNDDGSVKLGYEAALLYPKGPPLTGKSANGSQVDVAAECVRIATEHWGEKAAQMIKDELIKNPFKDGDGKDGLVKKTGERKVGYAGHKFIGVKAGKERPPTCYGATVGADGKLVKLTDPAALYPGCYVHAVVNAFTWENDKGGRGISFGINLVQFAKDGERIGGGGGPNPDSFFEGGAVPAGAGAPAGGGSAGDLFA